MGHKHTHIHRKKMTNRWLWIRPPRHSSILGWNDVSSVINVFCSAPSISTDIQSFCAFLLQEYKWLTEYKAKEQHLNCHFYSVLFRSPRVTIGSNKKSCIRADESSKQAASERRCPRVRLGQPINTLSFLFPSPLSLASNLHITPWLCPPSASGWV